MPRGLPNGKHFRLSSRVFTNQAYSLLHPFVPLSVRPFVRPFRWTHSNYSECRRSYGCWILSVSAHLCTHKILTNSFVTLPKTLTTLAEQRRLQTPWTSWCRPVGQAADVLCPLLPHHRTKSPAHTMHMKVSRVDYTLSVAHLSALVCTKYGYNCTLSIRITA